MVNFRVFPISIALVSLTQILPFSIPWLIQQRQFIIVDRWTISTGRHWWNDDNIGPTLSYLFAVQSSCCPATFHCVICKYPLVQITSQEFERHARKDHWSMQSVQSASATRNKWKGGQGPKARVVGERRGRNSSCSAFRFANYDVNCEKQPEGWVYCGMVALLTRNGETLGWKTEKMLSMFSKHKNEPHVL